MVLVCGTASHTNEDGRRAAGLCHTEKNRKSQHRKRKKGRKREKCASNPLKIRFIFIVWDLQIVSDRQILDAVCTETHTHAHATGSYTIRYCGSAHQTHTHTCIVSRECTRSLCDPVYGVLAFPNGHIFAEHETTTGCLGKLNGAKGSQKGFI